METLKTLRFAMPAKHASRSGADDLFRSKLDNIIDPQHELAQLGRLIDWSGFDDAFGRFYRSAGRPALPTRLMVGLFYLKHSFDVSDERLLELWVENPYWQHFCGFAFFQHKPPCDPITQTKDAKGKLYSLHAPEVACFNRGKASGRYEFGAKVGIAATNREGFVLAAKAFEGTPYDGHTLKATIEQSTRTTGVDPKRIYVDRGYRGHDYDGKAHVIIADHASRTKTQERD